MGEMPVVVALGDIVSIDDDGRRARVVGLPRITLGVLFGDVHETVDVEAIDDGERGAFALGRLTVVERKMPR